MSVSSADKSKPYIPSPVGLVTDGYSKDGEATATCFCGAVQLAVPTDAPGLVGSFVCNCTDCHKLSSSMFCSNFTVLDSHLKHLRGQDNLTQFGQATSVLRKAKMTNYFCKTCGTLMYRVGDAFPGMSILRIGTVDDFNLMETKLKPTIEAFTKDRVSWLPGLEGVEAHEAMF